MKNERDPTLSVIVANYNNEAYIRDCLVSILMQTYKRIEVVVVDDDSTDNSPGIIREYQEKYPDIIKGFYNDRNRGVARTRHKAILNSTGEYITTLDSDDYYYDHQKLDKEMELIRYHKEKNNKEIIAYSNIILVNKDKNLIRIWGDQDNIKQGKLFYEIITRTCLIPRDFLMKRDVYFEVGGYDDQFLIYEDWDLKIRLAAKHEFFYSGINGIAYRRHSSGLSAIPISENVIWLKKVFKKNIVLLNEDRRKDAFNEISNFILTMISNYRNYKKA
jgi:glycosyltransferase involved in cell wall biosynthesis